MKSFFLFFLLTPFILSAQITQRDSLVDLIDNADDLKVKALLYSELAKHYEHQDIDSAIYYAQTGYRLSKKENDIEGIAENVAALGDFYVIKNNLDEAKIHYSIALQNFREIERPFDVAQISLIIGNINLTQNNYIEALQLYQESLESSTENDFELLIPHLNNNLGTLYLQLEDYDDAQVYFERAYALFMEKGDEYNAAQSLSNISDIKSSLGYYDEAISGYLDVIRMFSISENWEDIAMAYNSISEIYFATQEYKKAEDYHKLAMNTIENQSGKFKGPISYYQVRIYTTAAKLLFNDKKYNESKRYAKNALELSFANSYKKNIYENAKIISMIFDRDNKLDSALAYYKIYIENSEAYQKEYDVKRITQLKMQYKFDEILKRKEIEEIQKQEEYKRKELFYTGIIIISILAIVIMILLYLNQRSKTVKGLLKQKNLELEAEKLNQDIDYKKKELASNMMYLIEKNEFITTIARKLKEIKPSVKKDNQEVIQRIINELRKNSSEKLWDEFEIRFKEVHSDFYDALSATFPDLTPNEIKLCAFLRLNMTTKEISAITHQSIKSINMARFRLRKKINIERDENLIVFLSQL
jgi:tetratricopeptide (TPR) repeat protein